MQMTTREAVEQAICCIEFCTHGYNTTEPDKASNERMRDAAKLLCEHYGFKLSQFFDVEVVE